MLVRSSRRLAIAVLAAVTSVGLLTAVTGVPKAQAATYDAGWVQRGTGYHWASPTVADLNGDGQQEVVVGDFSGILRVFRADGSVAWADNLGGPIEDAPAIGDINGDGHPDIVIGIGGQSTVPGFIGVVALDRLGNVLWRHAVGQTGVLASPALGDIDGDGRADVVFGALDHFIYALHGDGTLIAGFPFNNTDSVQSTPALYDTDGDGRLEIAIGGDGTHNPNNPNSFDGGYFRVLDWNGGVVRVALEKHFTDIIRAAIAIGDIQGDGRIEAVFPTGGFPPYDGSPDATRVYAIHLDDGTNATGWPKTDSFARLRIGRPRRPGRRRRSSTSSVGDQGGNVYGWLAAAAECGRCIRAAPDRRVTSAASPSAT